VYKFEALAPDGSMSKKQPTVPPKVKKRLTSPLIELNNKANIYNSHGTEIKADLHCPTEQPHLSGPI
jgi:hypothetical protein